MKKETTTHQFMRMSGYLGYRKSILYYKYTLQDKIDYDNLCKAVLTKDEYKNNLIK